MFSDSDEESELVHKLSINEHYAKAYEAKKEREELAELKEKYGSDLDGEDEEDSEDAESEDEDGEELTPAVDAAILRTLARIKRKDPAIYDHEKSVFQEEQQKLGARSISKRAKQDKSKPVTIRQHALASALNPTSRSPSPQPPTYVQEQSSLRKEAIDAFHTAISAEDEDDFLVLREKTKDETEKEEEEYREFLQREVGEDLQGLITVEPGDPYQNRQGTEEGTSEVVETKSKKKKSNGKQEAKGEKSSKTKEDKDQQFLIDYILNRGWIDRSERRLPTYKEVTSSAKGKERAHDDHFTDEDAEMGNVENESSDEDEFDDVVDRFESSYNFRFEEPDAATISRYPRNITSLVRRQDTSRKETRERRKARKEEELLKKKEEIKRLKSLKLKELRVKLERIGREGGKSLEDTQALQDLDLDADWDPDAHDRQMADIYVQGEDILADDEKPRWDDDIDITDIIPEADGDDSAQKQKKKKKKKKQEEAEDDDGVNVEVMDADVEKFGEDEEWDGTEEMRKRKLDEYMGELYGMEFNDMVAGMPTRFKYASVPQQSYALTPVEILLATDSELNQYMGIKKYAPYRKDGSNWDKNRSSRLQELKAKLKERAGRQHTGDVAEDGKEKVQKKRKGKKERMKEKTAAGTKDAVADEKPLEEGATPPSEPKSKSLKRKIEGEQNGGEDVQPEMQAKKRRRKHKKSGVTDGS